MVKNIWKSYIWTADKDVNESDPRSEDNRYEFIANERDNYFNFPSRRYYFFWFSR